MSNFWNLSDGTKPEQTTTFDTGSVDLIPDNTDVLACVDEAGWKAGFEGAPDLINLRWTILKPQELKNRKVFQKLRVNDPEAKNSDKAKRMLMAIDTNAGGKLAKMDHEPEDGDLMLALMNKPMVIKIKVWEMSGKKGNFVAAVSPSKARAAPEPTPAPVPVKTAGAVAMDDDIPFAPISNKFV